MAEVRAHGAWRPWLAVFLKAAELSAAQAADLALAVHMLQEENQGLVRTWVRAPRHPQRLLNLLVGHCVIDLPTVAKELDVTQRTAGLLASKLEEMGAFGGGHRPETGPALCLYPADQRPVARRGARGLTGRRIGRLVMEEQVLVFPRKLAQRHAPASGFTQDIDGFMKAVEPKLCFKPRSQAESDTRYKQLIPFVLIRRGSQILRHLRGSGDDRLAWSWSLGLGGHINQQDVEGSRPFYRRAMLRELHEEVHINGPLQHPPGGPGQ